VIEKKINDIRLEISKLIEKFHIPCLSIGILSKDVEYFLNFGFKDLEKCKPVNEYTLFCIASITKMFASLLTLKIQELGKLSIYDKISKYIQLKCLEDVTIENLLSHTSGIPAICYAENVINNIIKRRSTPYTDIENVINLFNIVSRYYKPGEKFLYLNEGYLVVEKILEKVCNEDFEKLMRKYILDPLDMSRTGFKLDNLEDIATPYLYRRGRYYKYSIPLCIRGDGGLISCSKDMLKFILMLINRGRFRDVEIISKESINEFEKERIRLPYNILDEDYYCLGLVKSILKSQNLVIYHHSGSILIHTSFLAYIPDRHVGVIVLQSGSNYPPILIGLKIISKILDIPLVCIKPLYIDYIYSKLEGKYISHSGIYSVKVVRKGGFLTIVENYRSTILIPEDISDKYCRFYTLSSDFRKIYAEFEIEDDTVLLRFERYLFKKVY